MDSMGLRKERRKSGAICWRRTWNVKGRGYLESLHSEGLSVAEIGPAEVGEMGGQALEALNRILAWREEVRTDPQATEATRTKPILSKTLGKNTKEDLERKECIKLKRKREGKTSEGEKDRGHRGQSFRDETLQRRELELKGVLILMAWANQRALLRPITRAHSKKKWLEKAVAEEKSFQSLRRRGVSENS